MGNTHINYVVVRLVVEQNSLGYAKPLDDIYKDIEFANKIYEPTGIQFIVCDKEIRPVDLECVADWFFSDGKNYPNELSVYYVFPRKECFTPKIPMFSEFAYLMGETSTAYKDVVVFGLLSNISTLAHEFGHVGGLKHTFDGDNNSDVCHDCGAEYHNLMNYVDNNGEDAWLTQMQLKSFRNYFFKENGNKFLGKVIRPI